MHQQVTPLLDEEQRRLLDELRKKMDRRKTDRSHGTNAPAAPAR
jgi:hypothetical protein